MMRDAHRTPLVSRVLALLLLVGTLLVVPVSAQTLPQCRALCTSTFATCLDACITADGGIADTIRCAAECQRTILQCWLACAQ